MLSWSVWWCRQRKEKKHLDQRQSNFWLKNSIDSKRMQAYRTAVQRELKIELLFVLLLLESKLKNRQIMWYVKLTNCKVKVSKRPNLFCDKCSWWATEPHRVSELSTLVRQNKYLLQRPIFAQYKWWNGDGARFTTLLMIACTSCDDTSVMHLQTVPSTQGHSSRTHLGMRLLKNKQGTGYRFTVDDVRISTADFWKWFLIII